VALSHAQADAARSRAELATLHERVHAGEQETEAHKLELDRRIEHVQQRLIEMERILEADAAAQTRDRAELAEIRQQCGIPAGDSRSTVEVIKGIKRAVASLEAASNSTRAELARVLAERDKLAAQLEQTTRELARARSEPFAGARSPEEAERHRRLQPLLGYLNGLEVDLAEATAENELRRSRREQPAPQEVEKVAPGGRPDDAPAPGKTGHPRVQGVTGHPTRRVSRGHLSASLRICDNPGPCPHLAPEKP
jgi:hypothetical protein